MDTLAHGIGVTNRFELFLDEETDPLEILRKQEEEKQKRKVEKTQIKSKPTKVAKSNVSPKKPEGPPKAVKIADAEVPNKPRVKNDRPARNYTESKEVDKNFRNKDDQFFNPEQRDEFRRGRGGFRGGRGGRGGERGRGYFPNADGRNRNQRMFDRHSGSDKTGVRSTEKREGAGSNNWGDIRSDINQRRDESGWDEEFEGGEKPRDSGNWGEDLNESAKFGEAEVVPKPEGAPDNVETTEADQTVEEQIQDAVKEMTLDEYKKEQEAKRLVPKYNLRKPGEGEDDKQWKKSYILKKKLKEEESDQDEEEELEDEDAGRKAQQKVDLDKLFNFTDSRRGNRGRGRGGRGGPRGIGGRDNQNRDSPREDRPRENRGGRGGGPAKPKAGQAAPRVDDFNDFPSLVNA